MSWHGKVTPCPLPKPKQSKLLFMDYKYNIDIRVYSGGITIRESIKKSHRAREYEDNDKQRLADLIL